MLVLALTSVLANSRGSSTSISHPLVAFSCRYYYPAGSQKTSVHQVYVSEVSGKKRRQLTFDASEKTGVQWVGKKRLAWIESEGISKGETWYGYHMPTGANDIVQPRKLVMYNLKTGNRKVVAHGDFEVDTTDRGVARYTRVQDICKNDVYETLRFETYKLRSKGITTSKGVRNEDPSIEDKWSVIKFDKAPVGSSKEFVCKDRGGGTLGDMMTQFITLHGKTVFAPVNVDQVWKSKDGWKAWFQKASRAGSAGSNEWIYEIDWRKGTCKIVVDDVLGIDFEPQARYWSAGSNNKTTTQLGKLRVWQSELWVGDLKNGKQWRLAAGQVHGDSAVIQP